MTKTRKTKKLISNITREDAELAFADYAAADAEAQKLTAHMDIQITRIREKYQTQLAELQERKEEAFDKLQAFATQNRDLFGNRKSIEMAHGILGFRTGTPKLKTLKGFTWPSVLNLLKEYLPTYIRVSEEPAKDRLLADREDPHVASLFHKVGICVDQDETFFIEPKKEEAIP